MHSPWYLLLALLLLAGCGRTATVTTLSVVPEPLFSVQKEGSFTLHRSPKISVVGLGQNSATVRYIMQSLRHAHLRPSLVSTSASSDIELALYDTLNPELADEGYLIEVRPAGIALRANTETGLFYAYQTFSRMMLPDDIMDVVYRTVTLPECTVLDRPRFAWRGIQVDAVHLPVSVRNLRRWVDLLATYKMNRLHLLYSEGDYTADDLAQLCEYATDRCVQLIPRMATDSGAVEPLVCHTLRGALDSARAGRQVVVSPDTCFDLSRYQADARYQPPAAPGMATLANVYAFDPAPVGTNVHVKANLLGGMCRLHTDRIESVHDAEYMMLPRLMAVSECLWSAPTRKNWTSFRRKVEDQKNRLDEWGYAYCEGSFTPRFTARRVDNETVNVAIATEVPNTYIFYTTDLSTPTRQSAIYLGPINLRRGMHIKILPVYKDQERDSVYEFIIR